MTEIENTTPAAKVPPVAWAVVVSIVLFAASLPLIGLQGNPPLGTFTGWECLATGWSGVPSGYPAWLANLAYLPMLIALGMRKRKAAIGSSALFMTLALFSFQYVSTAVDFSSRPEPEFERLGPAFWLWLASGVPPLIASLSLSRRRSDQV